MSTNQSTASFDFFEAEHLPNAAMILRRVAVDGRAMVLAFQEWSGRRYVIWDCDPEDGSCWCGRYFADAIQAKREFKKAARQLMEV